MKVTVVGSGYVGLVTGVCLAADGHEVRSVDVQADRIDAINRCAPPFYEPGLPELLRSVTQSGRFSGTTDLARAVREAEVVIIAVGTPTRGGRIDLTALEGALQSIGQILACCEDRKTVVMKSTVVPGTTDTLARSILECASGKNAGQGFGLAMNPEFLREGSAVQDFRNPDRIVIGSWDDASARAMDALYAGYSCPRVHTTPRNAELAKYTANALLGTLISFSNEVAAICESVPGTDVQTVMEALHLDRRLSPVLEGVVVRPQVLTYLAAGAGFGGSCLPKDIAALLHFGAENGVAMPLLRSVLDVNLARPAKLAEMLRRELGALNDKKIALLGLAFKPGTDDLRESPALRLAAVLLQERAELFAVDPFAASYTQGSVDSRIRTAVDPREAFRGADAIVLVTAWPQFIEWNWETLVALMRTPVVLDGRNALHGVRMPADTRYRCIGTAESPREPASVG